jgi:hypothetical protein
VGSAVDKAAIGKFSMSISGSLANHDTDCSTLVIYHLGLVADVPNGFSLIPPQKLKEKSTT